MRYLANLASWFGPLRVLESITFRCAVAVILSFALSLLFAPRFIAWMRKRRATEDVDKPDAEKLNQLHNGKKGTPTMGGLFLIASVSLTVLLCCDPANPLVWVGQFILLGFGALGFWDDYVKLHRIGGRQGLSKRQKFAGQMILAFTASGLLALGSHTGWFAMSQIPVGDREADIEAATTSKSLISPTRLVVPFTKWNEVNPDLGFFYWLFVALILVACSNAVNLTDGLDGLAIGCSALVALTYCLLAYLVGNMVTAVFFRIPLVPGAGELSIYGGALFGGALGFLWFNANPAQVFMGDTGSLSMGAAVAFMAVATKHELALILAGGVFVFEALSVILQVGSFRLTGRRLFRIAPFHHHLEYGGWKENHVVVRIWIVGVMLAIMTLGLLKMH